MCPVERHWRRGRGASAFETVWCSPIWRAVCLRSRTTQDFGIKPNSLIPKTKEIGVKAESTARAPQRRQQAVAPNHLSALKVCIACLQALLSWNSSNMTTEHAVTPAATGAENVPAHAPAEAKNGASAGYSMKLYVHSSTGDSGGCVIVCEPTMQIRFVESKSVLLLPKI